jgi:hypothetical protein
MNVLVFRIQCSGSLARRTIKQTFTAVYIMSRSTEVLHRRLELKRERPGDAQGTGSHTEVQRSDSAAAALLAVARARVELAHALLEGRGGHEGNHGSGGDDDGEETHSVWVMECGEVECERSTERPLPESWPFYRRSAGVAISSDHISAGAQRTARGPPSRVM